MSQNELSKRWIQGKTINTTSSAQHKLKNSLHLEKYQWIIQSMNWSGTRFIGQIFMILLTQGLLELYHARASVHAIASCQHILPRLQNIIYGWFVIFHHVNSKNLNRKQEIQLNTSISSQVIPYMLWDTTGIKIINSKLRMKKKVKKTDRSNGNPAVNVWGSIQWIKNNTVPIAFQKPIRKKVLSKQTEIADTFETEQS